MTYGSQGDELVPILQNVTFNVSCSGQISTGTVWICYGESCVTRGTHYVDRSCCIPDVHITLAMAGIMHKCEFTPFEFFHSVDL
jgi:hypothetical protein